MKHVRVKFHGELAWLTKFPVSFDLTKIETIEEFIGHMETQFKGIRCNELMCCDSPLDPQRKTDILGHDDCIDVYVIDKPSPYLYRPPS